MSKQPVRGIEAESLPEDAVATYLQHNPDFFERHTPLLAKLKLPHSRGASTISLVERQVLVLREKNEKLETHLQELISVARANDALANKIHRLSCRLIRTRSAEAVLDTLESSLREDFGASEWLILLAPAKTSGFASLSNRHLRLIEPTAPELKMFETLFESGKPRCGQIRDSQRDFLFGAGTIEIGSAALVPLGSQPAAGLLAVGSPDAERFHPTMSTEFLARIGNLVSEAVATP
ncbi:MAG TPA: DUF484 family protein [Povalibacter sp.]|nr:DUF484 family protein [Povalibacter sp.]